MLIWGLIMVFSDSIEHTRHRPVDGFLLNMISVLIASNYFPKKPSLKIEFDFSNQNNQLLLFAA
jgi:hypothetical protein